MFAVAGRYRPGSGGENGVGFFVAGGFVALAAMSQVIRGTANLAPHVALSVLQEPWFALVTFHIPLAIGVTLCLVLVLHYWRWILWEKID